MRRTLIVVIALILLAGAGWFGMRWNAERVEKRHERSTLLAAIQPVKLANCEFERFGEAHDGGYVACKNLLDRATAVYSYGIGGIDDWGCSMSARVHAPVHQYDCFNTAAPMCENFPGAQPRFHAECVGPDKKTADNRPFDTIASQIDRNGDAGKRLIMKLDVEGAEWPSFMAAPDAVLDQVDQLVVEFHLFEPERYLDTIEKLKRLFYIANLHWNNAVCDSKLDPLTSPAFEILFVNKKIGQLDPSGALPIAPNPLDAPNITVTADCQAPLLPATESKSPR